MLHNTMENTLLTLNCLVDGDSTRKAFPVPISSAETVGELRKLIKTKKTVAFSDIDADELTLWKVSIPDDGDVPILHDYQSVENELRATSKLFTVFKDELEEMKKKKEKAFLPEDTIHILVERPPPVQASDSLSDESPPSTPKLLQSVPIGLIEKELTVVLEGVNYPYITQLVDPKDVESSQRERLGPFYKRALPYHKRATDTSLVMLGLELGKQASTSDGETLHSIVEGDIGNYSDLRVVAMVAPSGSRKTATVVDLASKHFVIYCVCCSPSPTISPGFKDPNFIALAKDVERIYRSVLNKKQGPLSGPQDIDSEVKALVGERVELEFLARLLFLQLLLNNKPDLEPQQFFREQTTRGAWTIRALVKGLRKYDNLTIQDMLDVVQTKLHAHLDPRRRGLAIALDDAQVAVTSILAGKFISPSALAAYWNTPSVLFDVKNEIHPHLRRGFLTPLSATLSNLQATLVILGTALSLQDADHVYSAIAKPTNFSKITDFPQFSQDDVIKLLSGLIDMSDCEIPPAKCRKLTGRARFSIDVVRCLATRCSSQDSQDSKQAILLDAVDKSIENTMNGLRVGVRVILESDKTGEAALLLSRMVLAYHLQDAKISFSIQQQSDFVDKALCRLRPHPDGIHLIMDEPIVIEAVQAELKASDRDPAFLEYLDQLYQLVANFGIASASKGDALEPLIRRSLQRFNGFRLADLPFLQGIALPSWCNNLQLQIDEINTANGFGCKGCGIFADLIFFTERPPNKMLIAKGGTRPDGAWFFSDKRYAGSLAIKFYSSPIPQKLHLENETSSDLRACFLKADGQVNRTLASVRRAYEDTGVPSELRGILRIHLEFPNVQYCIPATHVRINPTTGVEDVMVYINLWNMDDFFYEGISEHKDDMVKLKSLIKFVTSSK